MNVLVYLIPMALTLGLLGLAAFIWSLKSGQYDDVEGAALRVLADDDVREPDRRTDQVAAATADSLSCRLPTATRDTCRR